MLRRAAQRKYRSSMDLADAYEQIRIVPEHVDRTATTTPGLDESYILSLYRSVHGHISG